MWTTVAGIDRTNSIPMETLNFQQTIGDPSPTFSFDVRDDGSKLLFHFGDEVIVWNEHAPPQGTITGHTVAATPAHNLVQLTDQSGSSGGAWAKTGSNQALISPFPNLFPNMTFSNSPFSSAYKAAVLADAPQAYYRLDETSGTVATDSSGHANNGTITGTVTLNQSGPLIADSDGAMLLDGSTGCVVLPSGVNPGGWTAFTLEAWIKFTAIGANFPRLISNAYPNSSNTGIDLGINFPNGGGFVTIGTGSTFVETDFSQPWSAGQWYHLVATYDGSAVKIYVNATLVKTMAVSGAVAASSSTFGIGRNNSYNGDYFPGTVDEVAIYNTALSASRIQAHYNTATVNTPSTSGNAGLLTAITPSGYIHPGQQYMFSLYTTIPTPLTNALCDLQMQFQDGAGNLLGSPVISSFASTTSNSPLNFSFTSTISNSQLRVFISATAPAGAAYCQVWFGGQTTGATNSGTINFGTGQLEPMYFTAQGISYPTPDCNINQADCATMPDGTTSRAVRLFSGYIELPKREYIGPNRIWHIQCAGPGKLLENGLINAVYTNQLDSQILTSVISNYFSGQISINAPNTVSPSPVVAGVTLSSVSYADNTLREVLNGLSDASGYMFFLDPYYRLAYQPQISSSANFALSDSPDNKMSFPYYEYTYEEDGTQTKRRVKINGGKFLGNRQDTFNGDGTTKQFNLTYIPSHIASLTVGGVAQKVGVYGRDNSKLGTTYDVLLNKQSQYILFNTAPATGTNNVVATYAYEAPVTTQTTMQTSGVVIPGYALPLFDAKVNDSNIVDLATATTRGLAEIVKNGNPLVVITCKSQQYASAGQAIFFTSTPDNIINQPYVIQQVTGTMLGNNELLAPYNEFSYTLGAYQPTLHDHIRNAHKALNRSSTVANVTAAQQFDFVAMESVSYYDSVRATPQTQFAVGIYGTGKYGQCSYGGQTGKYGSTAQYGVSTIYG